MPGPKKVRITVPEQYKKVPDGIWDELEKYVFEGFLVSQSSLMGRGFVFKTLNHHELRNISFMKPFRSSPPSVKEAFRTAFIAYSIFMIDGSNALHDRPRHIDRLIKIVGKLPSAAQEKVVENLAAMNSRAASLHPLVESYVHEARSRFRWMQLRSSSIHSPLSTGIPGTEELGMNHCQASWVALNGILDRREEMERDWSNAKFIGSCFNSKGVRAVEEKDRGRREKERQEIEENRLKVLHRYLNRLPAGEDPQETTELPDKRTAIVHRSFKADTVEELADQLSAALSGEKDHHDLVVEAKILQMQKRVQEMSQGTRKIYSSPQDPVISSAPHAGGTSGVRILGGRAEADAYVSRMGALRLDRIMMSSPDLQGSDGDADLEPPG